MLLLGRRKFAQYVYNDYEVMLRVEEYEYEVERRFGNAIYKSV